MEIQGELHLGIQTQGSGTTTQYLASASTMLRLLAPVTGGIIDIPFYANANPKVLLGTSTAFSSVSSFANNYYWAIDNLWNNAAAITAVKFLLQHRNFLCRNILCCLQNPMIRDFQSADGPQVKSLHKSQGFDYALGDLDNPLFLVRKVREVNGRVVGAMFLKLTVETYLLVEGSPETKARSILELQPEVLHEAYEKGLSDVFFVVPPEIASEFGPVVERLGWSKRS